VKLGTHVSNPSSNAADMEQYQEIRVSFKCGTYKILLGSIFLQMGSAMMSQLASFPQISEILGGPGALKNTNPVRNSHNTELTRIKLLNKLILMTNF
jgi:hypothetical protein